MSSWTFIHGIPAGSPSGRITWCASAEARLAPLPPLVEQERILAEVERLLSISDSANSIVQPSIARAASLRQSILKWAFEGRLVDQDPTDERASRLLERIRAERESTDDESRRIPRRTKASSPKACRRLPWPWPLR